MSALNPDTIVAVLGAGTMGAGIAHVAAEAGHWVVLYDTNQEVIGSALRALRQRLDRSVAKGRRSEEEAAALLARISPGSALAELGGAGLVIEAIVEDLGVKREVFAELEGIVPADAILATNTSSLSVTAIAAGLRNPSRVVGMHFFNPAPVMPLVEIVVGADTSPSVADGAYATAEAWGKTPVRCTSTPGFIVNRVARPFYSESLRILDEGVADIATIDAIVTGSGGFRMGPFTLMDLVGLDVNLAVSTSVYEQSFHDPRFAPHVRQRAKVDAGHLGQKTGRGWYDHAEGSIAPSPSTLPPGPQPAVVLADESPLLDDIADRLQAGGVTVERTELPFCLEVDGVQIFPTDGRPAAMLMLDPGLPDRVTLDFVLDWATAERVAIAAPPNVPEASVAKAAGAFQAAGIAVSRIDDAPGMVLARIIAQLVSVAADAATAGVAAPEDIDTAMRLGTNYPGGPFTWAESLGVARIQMVLDHLRWFYGEDRYRMPPAVRRAVLAGVPLRRQATRTL